MADSSRSGGVGVIGLLGVVFVTLKLTGVIPWSWWWVTAPFWGGLASVLALTVLLLAVYGTGKLTMGVMSLIDARKRQKKLGA